MFVISRRTSRLSIDTVPAVASYRRITSDARELLPEPDGPHSTIFSPARTVRLMFLSAWNAPEIPKTRGPSACHTLAQFDVTDGRMSCQMYQRSADMFLGVPFNIASYALLTHLLAKVTALRVGDYIHTFGDANIYENHLPQVDEQLKREPRLLPTLELDDSITSMDDLRLEQMRLKNYATHPPLRGVVAV